jgi:hypothetical protein
MEGVTHRFGLLPGSFLALRNALLGKQTAEGDLLMDITMIFPGNRQGSTEVIHLSYAHVRLVPTAATVTQNGSLELGDRRDSQ